MIKVKWFIALLMTMIMTSCEKAPINSKMDGMWKVKSIELVDGEAYTPYRLFYSIEQHSIEISDKSGSAGTYIGCFNKDNGTVKVSDFINGAGKVMNGETLIPFGMNELYTDFHIVKSSYKKMIWQSSYAVIVFDKF